jgi:glycosyltransferase involved in cell wall biosynthesis
LRIAQLLSGRTMNGAVRYCLTLSRRLAGRGHEVLLLHRPALDISGFDLTGVELARTSFQRWPGEISRVDKALHAWGAEVLHTHMSAAHASGAILRTFRGFPTVATAHKRLLQLHWPFNDFVIAPSAVTAAYHRRVNWVPARKLVVIPNFVEADAIAPPSRQARAALRAELGIAPDALVIGSVGDIMDYKRPSDLVVACGGLLQADRSARLVLIGGEGDREEVRRLHAAAARHPGQVLRLGRRRDAPRLIGAFDIYAMASRAEEMPMAVLEAMASAVPVVGTDVGGMGEMVTSGETGLLVPYGALPDLADAIARLASEPDLRRRMGEAARVRVLHDFAPGPIVERVEAVLERAAARRRSPA